MHDWWDWVIEVWDAARDSRWTWFVVLLVLGIAAAVIYILMQRR